MVAVVVGFVSQDFRVYQLYHHQPAAALVAMHEHYPSEDPLLGCLSGVPSQRPRGSEVNFSAKLSNLNKINSLQSAVCWCCAVCCQFKIIVIIVKLSKVGFSLEGYC